MLTLITIIIVLIDCHGILVNLYRINYNDKLPTFC